VALVAGNRMAAATAGDGVVVAAGIFFDTPLTAPVSKEDPAAELNVEHIFHLSE